MRLILAVVVSAWLVGAQICNINDPNTNPSLIPKMGTGGALATLANGSTVLFCTPNASAPGVYDYGCTPAPFDNNIPGAIVYLLILVYVCLCGVGTVSDAFMAGIEAITSVSKFVEKKDSAGKITQLEVKAWNPTVANLTLMALGSSAPEILLGLNETIMGKFHAGGLGPGTIVGSAAFNLMGIVGICVYCIPMPNQKTGETGQRKIQDFGVYTITAFFSIFAYLWLIVILELNSKDVVELWEAAVTFLFFPLVVGLAFAADKGWFSRKGQKIVPQSRVNGVIGGKHGNKLLTKQAAHQMLKDEEKVGLDDDEIMAIAQSRMNLMLSPVAARKSRAQWSVYATRKFLTGGNVKNQPSELDSLMESTGPQDPDGRVEVVTQGNLGRPRRVSVAAVTMRPTIGFTSGILNVHMTDGLVKVKVLRLGDAMQKVSVDYSTRTATAEVGKDFEAASGTLTFEPRELVRSFDVKILADTITENKEIFQVVLSNPSAGVVIKEDASECKVVIIDDTGPGTIVFAETDMGKQAAEYEIKEEDGHVDVLVMRVDGFKGTVKVQYATRDDSAIAGKDYIEQKGTLIFENGETSKAIRIPIIQTDAFELTERFWLDIKDPEGCKLGGLFHAVITILPDNRLRTRADLLKEIVPVNWDRMRLGAGNWKEQILESVTAPSPECAVAARIMHYPSVPFKLLFALTIPPTTYLHGFLTFFFALAGIYFITVLIADSASLFGCSLGLEDEITAIVFVALGTSLPDTFASKAAAIAEDTADSSIGNVTGSNSVNVFLGLGMSWLAAAIYWRSVGPTAEWVAMYPDIALQYPGQAVYVVRSGNLVTSVATFTGCALVCICVLYYRRVKFGAELGGPCRIPTLVMFMSLWVCYLAVSVYVIKNNSL